MFSHIATNIKNEDILRIVYKNKTGESIDEYTKEIYNLSDFSNINQFEKEVKCKEMFKNLLTGRSNKILVVIFYDKLEDIYNINTNDIVRGNCIILDSCMDMSNTKELNINNLIERIGDKQMNTNKFWSLIAETYNENKEILDQKYIEILKSKLNALPEEEIFKFYALYYEHEKKLYTKEMMAISYMTRGYLSNDGFEYFRGWVISQGKDIFEKALNYPESLCDAFEKHKKDESSFEFEQFIYVAQDVYSEKHGLEDHDIFYDEFRKRNPNTPRYPEIKDYESEQEMFETLPKLTNKLMGKFIVIKRSDAFNYLDEDQLEQLEDIQATIENGKDGYKNKYAVINLDEPYSEEIIDIMKKHDHWD